MKRFFDRLIRAIERNSRNNERRKLIEELGWLYVDGQHKSPRSKQIVERLDFLAKQDLDSYLKRNKPVKSVSQMVEEDDAGVPEGLVGESRAPV